MVLSEEEKLRILTHFALDSKPISCKPFGNGHINKIFGVRTEKGGRYILRRVNDDVFEGKEMLIRGVGCVSSCLISKGLESLQLMRTTKGNHVTKRKIYFLEFIYFFFSKFNLFWKRRTRFTLNYRNFWGLQVGYFYKKFTIYSIFLKKIIGWNFYKSCIF